MMYIIERASLIHPYVTVIWEIISLDQCGGKEIEAELFRGGGVSICAHCRNICGEFWLSRDRCRLCCTNNVKRKDSTRECQCFCGTDIGS